MGRRKQAYQKKPFESSGASSDTSANIYDSMLTSPAWIDLTARQKALYVTCKSQYYAERKVLDIDGKTLPQEYFTMNRAKWQERYRLYGKGSENSFYRDMDSLILHGFIDCYFCGAVARQKSIYRFSSRWINYGNSDFIVPNEVKSISLRNKEKA